VTAFVLSSWLHIAYNMHRGLLYSLIFYKYEKKNLTAPVWLFRCESVYVMNVLWKFRPIEFCTCALYTVSRTLSVRRWSTHVTRRSSSQSSSFSGQISSSVRLDATQSFTRAWCKYTVPIRQKSLTCGPNSWVCSA